MIVDGITITDDLTWEDEFDWSPIAQSKGFGATGALFIQESEKLAGRLLTFKSASESLGLIPRATLLTLQTSRDTIDNEFTIQTNDYQSFTVKWDHERGAIEAEPVVPYNQGDTEAWFRINALRFVVTA